MKKESGPKKLDTLFERYKQILKAPEQTVVNSAVAVIDELLDVTLTKQQISYSPQTRVLHIKHGLIRSAVLPHKQVILTHLTGRLGVRSAPKDII